MGWRDKYKVHPAADVFPMMDDAELTALGADIKANGQQQPVVLKYENGDAFLLDGRNRLEAMDRAGVKMAMGCKNLPHDADAVAFVISANIHRRHLTKSQQADLIVAAHKAAPRVIRQDGEKVMGRPVDEVKAAAVAAAAEHGISQRTVERAIAKAEGRVPKPAESDEERRDREECIALFKKAEDANRELAQWRRERANAE